MQAIWNQTNEVEVSKSLSSVFAESSVSEKWTLLKQTSAVLPSVVAGEKLGLFSVLRSPLSFSQLVMKLNVSEKGLDALLQILVGSNFIRQDPSSMELQLVDGSFFDLPRVATWDLGWSVATQRQFYYMAESVAAGRAIGLTSTFGEFDSLYTARAAMPEIAKYWDPWMQRINTDFEVTVAPLFKLDIAASYEVLDWCGNTGGNAIRIATAYANAHVTMLDLPEQCAKADVAISKAGLQDRVQTLPYNLLSPGLDLGHEVYHAVYMIHTIREWSYDHLARFFKAIYSALKPNGAVLMDMLTGHQYGVYTDSSADAAPAYFLTSAAHEQTEKFHGDVIDILTKAGFRHFRFTEGSKFLRSYQDGANLLAIK